MNDLKFALRQLLKCRSFVTVAVLTLVSPIGDCAARGQTHTIRAATLPSAREVLDRYVRAVGGREQWLKLRFAHLTGYFESDELGFSGPLELWTAAPNRHAARIGLERYGQVLQGFDGKRGWVLEPQQDIRFIEGSDLERLREEADFRAQLHEPASFARIETTAQLSWEERVCYQLHFVTKSGREFEKFFDRENGLLLGRRDADGAMTIYRDYRSFEGLKMPTLELKSAGGLRRQTIQISSVEFAPIKGRVFDYRRYEPHVERKLFPIAHKNGVGKADAADEIILKEMASIGIPGLAIAVIQRGQLVKAEGYGFADIEARRPVTPATVFQLCSLTKSFTALSVAWLAEEAKVSLDDPVNQRVGNLPAVASGITIRHLLTHSAGLAREPYGWNSLPNYDERAVLEAIFRVPLNRKPGDQFAYSNSGYHLLGILIQRVTGKPWHEWMATRLFGPLGMKDTGPLERAESFPERAVGYVLAQNGGWERGYRDRPAIVGAAGGLMSSVLDLAKFDIALSRGAVFPPSVLRPLSEPARLNDGETVGYGFGWYLNQHRGRRVVEHTGGNVEGLRTIMARFVDDALTIVILCNWSKADVQTLSRRVADLYLDAATTQVLKTGSSRKP